MKILVFGQSGQIASELQKQAEVIALGRKEADLTEPNSCAAVIQSCQVDLVVNAAGYTSVDKAEAEEELATLINGAAPAAMAEACAKKGIPFVHISTDYVFDGSGNVPWQPDDIASPLSAYGRSKLAGENGVRAAGGKYAILRTSWVFSAHGINFVKSMLRLGETHNALSIVSDQVGGPTAASDIAAACLSVGKQLIGNKANGTYHLSGSPDVSWAEFAREIFSQASLNVSVTDITSADYPTAAKRPHNSRLDGTSLNFNFGISSPDWQKSLSDVLAELKEQAT